MKMKKHIILLLLVLSVLQSGFAQSKQRDYEIHVLTVAPGDDLFTRFGHIALMVEDLKSGIKTVYNYGTFDFSDPDLRMKYARGFLEFWLSTSSYDHFLHSYGSMNRDVFIQTLNLSADEAYKIAEALKENALPENRSYEYRHYLDNCCTRIRDIIDDHTDGLLKETYKVENTQRNYRYWTRRALRGMPLVGTVILYSLGPAVDVPITRWEEQFLPEVLFKDLGSATRKDGSPFVKRQKQILFSQNDFVQSENLTLEHKIVISVLLILLLSLFIPLIFGKKGAFIIPRIMGLGLLTWGLIGGLGGLMLVMYWTVTTHYDTYYNENLIITPFTHLFLIIPAMTLIFKARLGEKMARILRVYLAVSLVLILFALVLKVGPFYQGNFGVAAFAFFLNAGFLIALFRVGFSKWTNVKNLFFK